MSISGPGAMGDGVEMMGKEQRSGGGQHLHVFADPQSPLGPETDHNFDIPEGKFALPPPVRGRDQLQALLRRQYLHKVSNTR